jgi:hydrogenase expression/formation protein HypC
MCLAVPGKITELHDEGGVPMARVDFGGITREACMACLPEARLGEYVLVHVGFAITRMDEEEAARTLADLQALEDADPPTPGPRPPAPDSAPDSAPGS